MTLPQLHFHVSADAVLFLLRYYYYLSYTVENDHISAVNFLPKIWRPVTAGFENENLVKGYGSLKQVH